MDGVLNTNPPTWADITGYGSWLFSSIGVMTHSSNIGNTGSFLGLINLGIKYNNIGEDYSEGEFAYDATGTIAPIIIGTKYGAKIGFLSGLGFVGGKLLWDYAIIPGYEATVEPVFENLSWEFLKWYGNYTGL